MITIKNENMTVGFNEKGAELRSVILDGKEQLWSGNPDIWSGIAPVLFPICGGLRDDKFTFEGKTYELKKHGFAKNMPFDVEKKTDTSVTFLLKSNEETLRQFPWEFEFRITYAVSGKCLKTSYNVKNLSEKTMYMAVGSHEGYACPEGIEEYDIIFERDENLSSAVLNGNLLMRKTDPLLYEAKVFPLYEKYFDIDALVFTDIRSRYVTLRNRRNGRSISVSFPGKDYLLLWHKPNADYICIEPWTGIPSYEDGSYELSEKEGMTAVAPKSDYSVSHEIHF